MAWHFCLATSGRDLNGDDAGDDDDYRGDDGVLAAAADTRLMQFDDANDAR